MKKTMRFLSTAALALVGAVMTGCSGDDSLTGNAQEPAVKSNVVTLTTTVNLGGDGTRALTIDGNKGVKTFAAGDKIALIYKDIDGNMQKAESEPLTAGGGKSATFSFELTDPDKTANVTYIYPAAMAGETDVDYTKLASQDGKLATISSNLDLATYSAAWDGNSLPTATLANELAIVAYTLKTADGTSELTSSMTGLTVSDGTNTYTVTRTVGAGPIYVAIRPTSGAAISYTATDGTKNYTKSVTGKTYAAGNIYQQGLKMTRQLPVGALSGVFTVGMDGETPVKVYFAKGNLRYVGAWSFFDNQWGCYTSYAIDVWDHFGWSTATTTYGMSYSVNNGDYEGDFVDWGTIIGTGWRTLTSAEWTYLFQTRTDAASKYGHATVGGKNGIIILPDDFTDPMKNNGSGAFVGSSTTGWSANVYTSGTNWDAMESAGAVFLPLTGYRDGTSLNGTSLYGYYWSGTADGTNKACYMSFGSEGVSPVTKDIRCYGCCVRLVYE